MKKKEKEVVTMNKKVKEIRYIPAMEMSIREDNSNPDTMAIKGYVVKFNERKISEHPIK